MPCVILCTECYAMTIETHWLWISHNVYSPLADAPLATPLQNNEVIHWLTFTSWTDLSLCQYREGTYLSGFVSVQSHCSHVLTRFCVMRVQRPGEEIDVDALPSIEHVTWACAIRHSTTHPHIPYSHILSSFLHPYAGLILPTSRFLSTTSSSSTTAFCCAMWNKGASIDSRM